MAHNARKESESQQHTAFVLLYDWDGLLNSTLHLSVVQLGWPSFACATLSRLPGSKADWNMFDIACGVQA